MGSIKEEGIYPVTVTEAYVAEMATNDKHPETRYQVVIVGTTEAGDSATYYGALTNTVVQGGKHKGRYTYEATLAGLKECGFAGDDPFDVELPEAEGGMVGRAACMKIEADDYNGTRRYKVAFLWPAGGSAKKVDRSERKSVWNAITGGQPAPSPAPAALGPVPSLSEAEEAALLGSDEIPF